MKQLDEELARLGDAAVGRCESQDRRVCAAGWADKLYQRLGWQPRCKPTVLPSGRILLPLYTDTFSLSIMAISDDGGESWFAGKPMLGFGAIQPAVLRRNDGTLVAYMRENGPLDRIRVAESKDDGLTWGTGRRHGAAQSRLRARRRAAGQRPVAADLQRHDPGPQSPGGFALGRRRAHLEMDAASGEPRRRARTTTRRSIQGRDGTIHAVYSYFRPPARA